jgi:hypothetical protein
MMFCERCPAPGVELAVSYLQRINLDAGGRWRTVLWIALLFLHAFALAEEAPIPVVYYYSKDEPHWREVEQLIDATAAKYPRLRVTKIDMDTPDGYKLLHQYETTFGVTEPGDLTATLQSIGLTDKGSRRDIERYFVAVAERLLGLREIKGKNPADALGAAAYAREVFGNDASATVEQHSGGEGNITRYRVQKGGIQVGWIVNVFQPIDCPICGDAEFLMAIKLPDLTIAGVRPLRELELKGNKLPADLTTKFLAQFNGRAVGEVRTGVDAISGATKTSHAYQMALFEVLTQLRALEKK